jgi:hypothetical protein
MYFKRLEEKILHDFATKKKKEKCIGRLFFKVFFSGFPVVVNIIQK